MPDEGLLRSAIWNLESYIALRVSPPFLFPATVGHPSWAPVFVRPNRVRPLECGRVAAALARAALGLIRSAAGVAQAQGWGARSRARVRASLLPRGEGGFGTKPDEGSWHFRFAISDVRLNWRM
jgi:hypothetical protein